MSESLRFDDIIQAIEALDKEIPNAQHDAIKAGREVDYKRQGVVKISRRDIFKNNEAVRALLDAIEAVIIKSHVDDFDGTVSYLVASPYFRKLGDGEPTPFYKITMAEDETSVKEITLSITDI